MQLKRRAIVKGVILIPNPNTLYVIKQDQMDGSRRGAYRINRIIV